MHETLIFILLIFLENGTGLGLLSAYSINIDSGYSHHDESSSDDERKLPKSTLDSEVANFLKEIDDLDATIPITNSKPKKKGNQNSAESSKSEDCDQNDFSKCIKM